MTSTIPGPQTSPGSVPESVPNPDVERKRRGTHATTSRIESLDLIRGVALLGILIMNSISFALPSSAYVVISEGSNNPLDWAIGLGAAAFVDEKMMGVFSLLFGVGIMLFAERAKANGRRANVLSVWRFAILLGFGLLHTAIWDGDILVVYAICAPFVLLLRRLPAWLLAGIGGVAAASSVVVGLIVQQTNPIPPAVVKAAIDEVDGPQSSDALEVLLLLNGFGRAIGLMLIGVALYKWNVVQGRRSTEFYRKMTAWGLGIGLPLAIAAMVLNYQADYAAADFLQIRGIHTAATVPLTLGYIGLITLWSHRGVTWSQDRLRAVGRMAMTNYLTQTLIGVATFSLIVPDADPGRTVIAGFVLAVWVAQLTWSTWWLNRFRFGPFEWLWRCCTYRRLQPMR